MQIVQSALVLPKSSWKLDGNVKPLLKALRVEHSDHPMLSDGAVPDALLRFINDRTVKVWGAVKLQVGDLLRNASDEERGKNVLIHYLVRAHHEDNLVDVLMNWSAGDVPKLAVPVSPARAKSMMFCIDKDAECFFWTAPNGRQLLEETLPQSARAFRTAMKPVRPTATDIHGILNTDESPVEDRYSRMEKDDEDARV